MRRALKQRLETLLAHSAPTVMVRRRRQGRALVLAYHNVVPTGMRPQGELSLHLTQRAFSDQLDFLVNEFAVVPLRDLSRPRPRGSRDAVAVTFDDAYQGAVTVGVDELARRGLPATIFVAPAFVDRRAFWWDMLASATGTLSRSLRTRLLQELRGDDDAIRSWARLAAHALDEALPAHARVATESELSEAVAHPGIVLGAHGWSHCNLARVDDERLRHELEIPLHWLRTRFPGATIPWLAYPYGATSPRVQEWAARVGYEGALAITGGWHRPQAALAYAIPRLNVSAALSHDGFVLRAMGVLA